MKKMTKQSEKLMDKYERYQRMYQSIAREVAKMSHAKKLKVGAILVKDGRIISMGWNGMPSGFNNKCEDILDSTLTNPEVLHAETNCIAKLAKSSESGCGSLMYVTHPPCIDCAKLIYQSGITEFIYEFDYETEKTTNGIKFLARCGIPVNKVRMRPQGEKNESKE